MLHLPISYIWQYPSIYTYELVDRARQMASVTKRTASELQACRFNSCQGRDLKLHFFLVTKVFGNKCTVYKFPLDNFHLQYPSNIIHYPHKSLYHKPPPISPGFIYFRKQFLMGLYKGRRGGGGGGGGLIYKVGGGGLYTRWGGGGLRYKGGGLYTRGDYTWTIVCVYKQVGHKQVSHKQENKHVLSSVTGLILIWGTYIRCMCVCVCVLYSGGLYLECGERLHKWWAYTWGGGLYSVGAGAYSRRFTVLPM